MTTQTPYRMICAKCNAVDSVVALGRVNAWAEVKLEVVDAGAVKVKGPTRVEVDDLYDFDTDEYECVQCGNRGWHISQMVKMIHPWSAEWMEVPADATH